MMWLQLCVSQTSIPRKFVQVLGLDYFVLESLRPPQNAAQKCALRRVRTRVLKGQRKPLPHPILPLSYNLFRCLVYSLFDQWCIMILSCFYTTSRRPSTFALLSVLPSYLLSRLAILFPVREIPRSEPVSVTGCDRDFCDLLTFSKILLQNIKLA